MNHLEAVPELDSTKYDFISGYYSRTFFDIIIRKPTRYRKGYKSNILDLVLTNNSYFVYDVYFDNLLDCSDNLSLVII